MSTRTSTYTYTHSVNYVTDQILNSFKDILHDIGLHPSNLAFSWEVLEHGIRTWLETQHLEVIHLEVMDPEEDRLVFSCSFEIDYEYETEDMWADPGAIRSSIAKQGVVASECEYRVVLSVANGAPSIEGWTSTNLYSTEGMMPQAVGTSAAAPGVGARGTYMRRS